MSQSTTARMRLAAWVLVPLAVAAVPAMSAPATADGAKPAADAVMHLARHDGRGSGDGDGSRGGYGMGQAQGQAGDRERPRTFEQMDQHLREMDRLRERIHQAPPGAERQRLMREYRNSIQQGRQGLGRMPDPGMSDEERLRYMDERQRRMDRMMEHMWQYQEEQQRAE